MRRGMQLLFLGIAGCLSSAFAVRALAAPAKPMESAAEPLPARVRFNRDIRPILSESCFACHGFDKAKRKAGLRLDTRDGAMATGDSGAAIVPGKPGQSLLLARVTTHDADEIMPPPKAKKPAITPRQIALLTKWIEQGAEWEAHWAYQPIVRPALPTVRDGKWVRNPIDAFVLARLEKEQLSPSPEADRATLIRRLTLDLTGLPPTPTEVDAFLADRSPDAYEKVVDRLLGSDRYAERMTVDWLDAARYADTHGYHIDAGRDMTAWRDWVIAAFKTNKPYDQFTIEQLAGDLLPPADDPAVTRDRQIASGFNRNHMVNFEGGAIAEEYRTAYVLDRTNTTGTVWLGLTVGCAQCHDHKFDPISQREYYQLYAFFNNVTERGLDGSKGNAAPTLSLANPEQQRKLDAFSAEVAALEKQLAAKPSRPADADSTDEKKSADAQRRQWADALAKLKKERESYEATLPTTMVMRELAKPRDTFILMRGAYDHPGEKVTAAVPDFLPPLPKDAPANRLSLARWLVDRKHPLTSRVTINRYWQLVFGTGLVKTTEDFGSQGEPPTHVDLLDWLAAEFMESGWDVRALMRLYVTSATYRQASTLSAEQLERDPDNRLLGRGSRYRLQAEFIRDQALAAAGLLDERIGGASVSPYQPAGLWEELMSRGDGAKWTAQVYVQSKGADLYRRTMYTFWKRTSPPPTLTTFDAPDREICTVRRGRTNTPLQALVLMNDPTYVEASRKLAERVLLGDGDASDAARLGSAFRRVLARSPRPEELAVLGDVLERQRAKFSDDRDAAEALLKVGDSKVAGDLKPAELAAWATVCSVILNLDEAVTRG